MGQTVDPKFSTLLCNARSRMSAHWTVSRTLRDKAHLATVILLPAFTCGVRSCTMQQHTSLSCKKKPGNAPGLQAPSRGLLCVVQLLGFRW